MLERLLPATFDNRYLGAPLALWIIGALLTMKTLIAANVVGLNPFLTNREVAMTVDRIPLDAYPSAAQSSMLFLFAAWGFATLILCLLGWLILARYRTMVPLLYLILLVEQLGRRVLASIFPLAKAADAGAAPAGYLVNLALTALLIAGFALSLWHRGKAG